jgi:pimeloyl-ACP methyl ester carboxylesterase
MVLLANGINIRFKDEGKGTPQIVFLHYWGGSSRTWDDVVAALPSGYRLIRPDLRGWGDSLPAQSATAPGYALSDFVADAEALIEQLGLENYVLVGHSMGGKVAQLLASKRPAGLKGLVLVASAPAGPLNLPPPALEVMASAYESADSVGMAIDHMLTGKSLSEKHRQQVIQDSLKGLPEAKAAWPKSASQEDITGEVGKINVATLIIAGELDKVDSPTVLKAELLTRIPRARLVELASTGHLSPLESPTEIADAIVSFIEDLPA